jgi:excisionase family DNA binding protein
MVNYISSGEAARILGISIQTLYNWEKEGKIVSHRLTEDGHRRFDEELIRKLGGRFLEMQFHKHSVKSLFDMTIIDDLRKLGNSYEYMPVVKDNRVYAPICVSSKKDFPYNVGQFVEQEKKMFDGIWHDSRAFFMQLEYNSKYSIFSESGIVIDCPHEERKTKQPMWLNMRVIGSCGIIPSPVENRDYLCPEKYVLDVISEWTYFNFYHTGYYMTELHVVVDDEAFEIREASEV